MRTKSILKSKTIWVNLITIIFVLANYYGLVPNEELADQASKAIIMISPFLNLCLRMVTKDAIKIY